MVKKIYSVVHYWGEKQEKVFNIIKSYSKRDIAIDFCFLKFKEYLSLYDGSREDFSWAVNRQEQYDELAYKLPAPFLANDIVYCRAYKSIDNEVVVMAVVSSKLF